MNSVARLTRPYKTVYKLALSYLKKDWEFNDYPLEFLEHKIRENYLDNPNITFYPWVARLINWYWMNGVGHTKEEALNNLKEKFNQHKAEGNILPRPGERVEVKFASVNRIEQYNQEAEKFFKDIFEMDYYDLFISDESSLLDFCWSEESLSEKVLRIRDTYGIEISENDDTLIVDILEKLRVNTSKYN